MTYRAQAEKARDADPPDNALFCERCRVPVPRSADARCPQCLRKTTLVDPKAPLARIDSAVEPVFRSATPTRAGPAVWPSNDTCPICAARGVEDASVYLRISKVASGVGRVTARIIARLRTCEGCRKRVVSLDRLRYLGAACAVLGLFGTFGFFIPTVGGISMGALGVMLFVGAIVLVQRRNRSLRQHLDDAGLTERLAELVPQPAGLVNYEFRVLQASTVANATTADLSDALRAARIRR